MKRMSRAGRLEQMVKILDSHPRVRTTHGLIREMGMKPSPHTRGMVYEAYKKEMIGGYPAKKENGREVFYWHSKKRTFDNQPSLNLFTEGEHVTQN